MKKDNNAVSMSRIRNIHNLAEHGAHIPSQPLTGGLFGIELEATRIVGNGDLALTPHPSVFGDKEKNPHITTDFSESQIEMITSPHQTSEGALAELRGIREIVERGIGAEGLWPFSMPPRLPEEDRIPIAEFTATENGLAANIYRNGLALRYGKKMQMISGLHLNYSFSDELLDELFKDLGEGMTKRAFTDKMYFAASRNFLRYRWLLIYLFGASPTCDQTYFSVLEKELRSVRICCPECFECHYRSIAETAVSLRVSRFGYSGVIGRKHRVLYNGMAEYSQKLTRMMATRSKAFAKIGVTRDGRQIQLNENILQKESEYYSSVRLKQVTEPGETQLSAMESRGVRYMEVRLLDIDPYVDTGIRLQTMDFVHVFLVFCLLRDSDLITPDESRKMDRNHHIVALRGRAERVNLVRYDGRRTTVDAWGEELLSELLSLARRMDMEISGKRYEDVVMEQMRILHNKSELPSEKIARGIKEEGDSFLAYGCKLSKRIAKKEQTIENQNGQRASDLCG